MPEETPVPSGGLFDKLAGKAKQAVGRMAGNQDLAEEGSLQTQKAETAIEATRLQAEADQAEREAELAAERERNQVEQARVEAELAERERTEQIAGEERAAKADVAELDARKQEAAAAQERAERDALERKEVDAVAERIDGAQQAAEIDAEARQAEAVADALAAAQREPRSADHRRMTMDIDQIRRDALSLWLRGIRLPLTVAEATVKRGQDTTSWPPALAFEKTEAAIKAFVGGIVRDDTLIGAANLQRAEVAQREEALAKRAEAEATRAEVVARSEGHGGRPRGGPPADGGDRRAARAAARGRPSQG